jgi:hypothetical protein
MTHIWYLENIRSLFTKQEQGTLFYAESGNRISRDTARSALRRSQDLRRRKFLACIN